MMQNYFQEFISVKAFSHLNVGGEALAVYCPETYAELSNLVQKLSDIGTPWYFVGGGSNTLFGDLSGTVLISDSKLPFVYEVSGLEITISANYNINRFLMNAVAHNLCGLEFLAGIPAHLGGLIKMNAGAYGETISNYLKWIKVLQDGKVQVLQKEEIDFQYRKTTIKGIVLEAGFELKAGNYEMIKKKISDNVLDRKVKQPLEYPNLGCFFKNPEGESAGRLIDSLGMKGLMVGGAQISEKHANFVINRNNASFRDVLNLINVIKDKVFQKYRISLELEIEVVNNE